MYTKKLLVFLPEKAPSRNQRLRGLPRGRGPGPVHDKLPLWGMDEGRPPMPDLPLVNARMVLCAGCGRWRTVPPQTMRKYEAKPEEGDIDGPDFYCRHSPWHNDEGCDTPLNDLEAKFKRVGLTPADRRGGAYVRTPAKAPVKERKRSAKGSSAAASPHSPGKVRRLEFD